ncbi:MAG TPA: DUF4411 family protein [Rhabdochlamydiaceae bacterium]
MPDNLFNNSEDSPIYVVDTSACIRLESIFKYDDPVFKAIWNEIEELIANGSFRIIDFVEMEINDYEGKEDFLKKWVKRLKKHLVVDTDSDSFKAAIPIINEEYNTGFFDAKKQAEGKDEADPYLIAYCKVHNCVLITNENKTKPNKIPMVSAKHGVRCIDIFEFLGERGLRMERKKI